MRRAEENPYEPPKFASEVRQPRRPWAIAALLVVLMIPSTVLAVAAAGVLARGAALRIMELDAANLVGIAGAIVAGVLVLARFLRAIRITVQHVPALETATEGTEA